MPAVDPLQSSFFNPSDTLTRKKEKDKEKSGVKRSFTEALRSAASDSQRDAFPAAGLEQSLFAGGAVSANFDRLSFDEKLTALVDSVYAAGDELKKNPFTDTFIVYKQNLSRFMRFVIDNAYELEVRDQRRGKKRRQLITVQTINEKLDELAAGILYNQSDQLKILAKIDEINGILVDFLS